jgi:molecular chaperone HscB
MTDYFAVFGLPRRLGLDPAELEPVYHALSREYHPDRNRTASGRERLAALERSALLNQAYRALRDPFERAAHLLRLEEGADGEQRETVPQELFEEILEVQDLLGDFRLADPDEQEALRPTLEAKRKELQSEQERRAAELTGQLFPRWDTLLAEGASDPAAREPLLARMRALLGERSYLRRVLNGLDEVLA